MADAWQSAWVEVLPDFSNFRREATPGIVSILGGAGDEGGRAGAKGFGSSFVGGIGKLALPIAGAFAALGIGSMIADTIRAGVDFAVGTIDIASDLNESVNAVRVAYGSIADEVLSLGQTSARTFGLSSRDLNAYAVQFSSFSKTIAGNGGDVSGTFESILGRATDFASVMNLDVSEALSLFQSGRAGETEPLRRYGLDLSAASVNAYAYASGIASAGTELTEAQKVQARYAYLLEQTNMVAGDFANTSDELANKQRIQAALWDDVQAKIGGAFLPVAAQVATILADDVIPAISELVDEHGPALAEAFAAALPQIQQMVDEVLPKLPELFGSLASTLPSIVEGLTALLPPLVDFLMALANGAVQIQQFFAGLGVALENGGQQWQNFFVGCGAALTNGAAQIGAFFGGIIGAFANGWAQISGFFASFGGAVSNGAGQIGSFAATVGQKIGEAVGFIGSLPGRIAGFFADAGSWLVNSGRALIQGFINGIRSMIGAVGDAVGGVIEWARGFFPNSPAKRGPLSGAGWNKLAQSGEDYITQWTSGFGRPDLTGVLSPMLSSAPRAAMSSAYASTAAAGVLPGAITLVDADGSILTRARVIAGQAVAANARAENVAWSSGGKSL